MVRDLLAVGLGIAIALLMISSATAAGEVRMSAGACQRVVKHAPANGGAYKAGVDVRGRRVAGADAGGASPIKLPDEISFYIGVDLEEKYGLGANGKYTGEGVVGTVTVKGGRVYYDGKLLDSNDQRTVTAACGRTYGTKG